MGTKRSQRIIGLIGLCGAFLLYTPLAAAAKPTYDDAVRLVSAMREDELIVMALRNSVKSAMRENATNGKVAERQAQCVDSFEYPSITDLVAVAIATNLSASEVHDAIRFYQAKVGKKTVSRKESELRDKVSSDTDWLSDAEKKELTAFMRTTAGKKLLTDNVTKQPSMAAETLKRIQSHGETCLAQQEVAAMSRKRGRFCESIAVSSPDDACTATYVRSKESRALEQAAVQVDCQSGEQSSQVTIDLVDADVSVALKWEQGNVLEILLPTGASRGQQPKLQQSAIAHRFRAHTAADPARLACLPLQHDNFSLLANLPLPTTLASWRSHREPNLCLLTNRLARPKIHGWINDGIVQFRRQGTTALPFGKIDLALIVGGPLQTRSAALRVDGTVIQMAPSGINKSKILIGKSAEDILGRLAGGGKIDIVVQTVDGSEFTQSLSRLDFEFAYAGFSECLQSQDPGAGQ